MLGKYIKNIVLFTITMLTFVVLSITVTDKFLTIINFKSMGLQLSEFGLLALGMMLVMITGGIDLSIVSITNLAGIIGGFILTSINSQMGELQIILMIITSILVIIVISMVCGLINGFLVAYVRIPPILATLGTNGLFTGIAILLTGGGGVSGFPKKFLTIGNGEIMNIPIPFLIFIFCTLVVTLILNKLPIGFNMQMLGSNSIATEFAGVNNRNVLIKTYVITALLAGIATIIMLSRTNSMLPSYGSDYLLASILVAILGGTDPEGGTGSVGGVVMGVFLLQFIQSGFNIMGFDPFLRKFVYGLMLILILALFGNLPSLRLRRYKHL